MTTPTIYVDRPLTDIEISRYFRVHKKHVRIVEMKDGVVVKTIDRKKDTLNQSVI